MSKIFVHAKTMIDGVSDTPKFDQLITCEDGKITAIEPYHTINEDVVEANVVTPGFFNCHVHIMEPVGFGTDKEFTFIEKTFQFNNFVCCIKIIKFWIIHFWRRNLLI